MEAAVTQTLDISERSTLVPAQTFRDGMSRVGAAVHIITTGGAAGRAGFTATAVASVADDPPTVLVCLNRNGRSGAVLAENGVFCVNTLAAEHQALADVFAGRGGIGGEERFLHGTWEHLATGAPVLSGALVAFDCRVVDLRPVATHQILIGQVEAIRLGPARPGLLYANRAYHGL
ncbi:MAG: flavin reductase [Methylacidiphilales bacterium]|nr:flavin reductase [Candidatus Methylacidiphilales bacterium]